MTPGLVARPPFTSVEDAEDLVVVIRRTLDRLRRVVTTLDRLSRGSDWT